MAAFQKTVYMVKWEQGKYQQDDPNYASRTYASDTFRLQALGIDTDSWKVTTTD